MPYAMDTARIATFDKVLGITRNSGLNFGQGRRTGEAAMGTRVSRQILLLSDPIQGHIRGPSCVERENETPRPLGERGKELTWGRCDLHGEVKPATLAGSAFHPDLASVELDQTPGDGQSQAPSWIIRGARFPSVELLEHFVEFVGRDHTPWINHPDLQAAVLPHLRVDPSVAHT